MSQKKVSIWYPRIGRHKSPTDFEQHANISLKNKYIYFAVDKTANSTVKWLLYNIEYSGTREKILTLYDKRCSPLLSPFQLGDELFAQLVTDKSFFKFAIVRNPYTRLLSCYLDRICEGETSQAYRFFMLYTLKQPIGAKVSFETFIKAIVDAPAPDQNSHWRVQYDDICYPLFDFDYIGKFETLNASLQHISKQVFNDEHPILMEAEVNKSPSITNAQEKIEEYYTDELQELVYKRYEKDFSTFGYQKDLPILQL